MVGSYSVLMGIGVLLVLVPVAFASLYVMLRLLDRLTFGSRKAFADELGAVLKGDPLSLAVYLGSRFIGACLLVGALFSRIV